MTLEDQLRTGGASGATWAWRQGGHAASGGLGTLRDEPAAIFPIYSITKTLIAAAVLQRVAEGVLQLDAPLLDQLQLNGTPGWLSWRPFTLREVLNHTAGLPDYGGLPAYHEAVRLQPGEPWSAEELLERVAPLPRPVGFAYSNIGYLLLRLLLEQLENQPLHRVLQRRLFEPLQLTHTRVAGTAADLAGLTPGHGRIWSAPHATAGLHGYHPGWVAHGLALSTAPELARLVEGVFSGPLVPAHLRAALQTAVPVHVSHPVFTSPGYGLGVMLDTASGLAGHGGGGPGYGAGALWQPLAADAGITAVALVNHDGSEAGLLLAHALIRQFTALAAPATDGRR
ncbi:serine hydrolase domain-containing protein [Deinococcus sonorensis]|uniref:Serine hydrolase domain-containing protein n=2 Tax=Deinococcus sonorensis TaxID=309891 RepID=A0AAU7UF75_9DEIO